MPRNKTGAIYAYNDPNWIDSALKRCTRFNSEYHWRCAFCCNYSICRTLMQEEREKQLKEREEELKNMMELKADMCGSWGSSNDIMLEGDYGPELVIRSEPRIDNGQEIYISSAYDRTDAFWDRARAYEVVEPQLGSLSEYISEILSTRTMRMTCDTGDSVSFEVVDSPNV